MERGRRKSGERVSQLGGTENAQMLRLYQRGLCEVRQELEWLELKKGEGL